MMKKRLLAVLLCAVMIVSFLPVGAGAADRFGAYGFTEEKVQKREEGAYHLLRHTASGAQVLWLENDGEERSFAAGFRTPPKDSMGENHVLEHALLCGSEKYPVRELMHVLANTSVADELNAYTSDDFTCYVVRTKNETDFYNLSDVYMSSVLFPLLRTEPNIFKQQGIRLEYVDGKAQYNGIVFSELKLRSLDTNENSLDFVSEQMYRNLYGDGTPTLASGGAIPDILNLTYDDVMRVYNTYYKPSNMLIYVAGEQDISKTLKMLNGYLSKADKGSAPEIEFDSAPIEQTKSVQEYNLTASTKTVDIGFMMHGPDVLDLKNVEAWNALVTYLLEIKMQEQFPDTIGYSVGGMGGGIYNFGIILAGVPVDQKDQAVQVFQKLLDEVAQNGIPSDRLNKLLDQQKTWQQFGREEIFTGFAYGGDPLACIDRLDVIDKLKTDTQIYKTLAAEWRTGKYQTTVISGNGGAKPGIPEPKLTEAELQQVKRDTEAFNAWIGTPDSPENIAKLPQLSLADFSENTFALEQKSETTPEAAWYHTVDTDAEQASFSLYFPIEAKADDLAAWCLLAEFLNDQMEKGNIGAYFGVDGNALYGDAETLAPALVAGGSVAPAELKTQVDRLIKLLDAPPLQDTAALRAFLTERKKQLKANFSNPFQTEYGLRLLASTQSNRFLSGAPAGFYGSSRSYQTFVDKAVDAPEKDEALLARLRGLLGDALKRGGVVTNFQGSETDYRTFQVAAKSFLAGLPEGGGVSSCAFLPGGWPSALVVSNGTQDDNHVMIDGVYDGPVDDAVLRVLGSVLGAKYLMPELRDKRGAYGTNISFDAHGMTMACAGGVPVDEVIAVYKGVGAYVRGLTLSDSELNGYIIGAIKEYDEEASWSRGNAAALARSGKTQADFERERAALMNVTLDDLRACADLLDRMTAQNRVFARVNNAEAKGIKFPFACRADADTGRVRPMLRADLPQDGAKTPLTRAEAAALIAESLIDQSAVERPELPRFTDASSDALSRLHDRGLLRGYEDGSFHPDAAITRAEFCSLVDTLAPAGTAAGPSFSDVGGGYWAHKVISRMAGLGYLKGDPEGTFRPEDTITGAEALTILRRLSKK